MFTLTQSKISCFAEIFKNEFDFSKDVEEEGFFIKRKGITIEIYGFSDTLQV